jgi:hypothetical protein
MSAISSLPETKPAHKSIQPILCPETETNRFFGCGYAALRSTSEPASGPL